MMAVFLLKQKIMYRQKILLMSARDIGILVIVSFLELKKSKNMIEINKKYR